MLGYDGAITGRFPKIRAGVIHSSGLTNGPSPPELLDEYRAEQRSAAKRLETSAIAEIPSIAAWRRVFTGFGAKPTQYRVAAEALLRRLAKHGDIPSINTLVDIGNLVSIRYAMPVAVFDQSATSGSTTVRFATGAELFTDLGANESVHPDPGEVIFVDDADLVSARRWCWRQSARSATDTTTTEALIIVEGHHHTADQDVESALADLTSSLATHQPGSQIEPYVLSPTNPSTGTIGDAS